MPNMYGVSDPDGEEAYIAIAIVVFILFLFIIGLFGTKEPGHQQQDKQIEVHQPIN